MKKIIALALGLVMVLGAVCVFAEDAAKTEMGMLNVGKAFRIQSTMPEGYVYMPVSSTDLNMVGILSAGEGRPSVTVSIAEACPGDGSGGTVDILCDMRLI